MSKILDIIKPGVVFGEDIKTIFSIAQDKKFAIPAINCSNIDTINAVLETAYKLKSPIIIQLSYSGSSFITGNTVGISDIKKSVIGALSAAQHVHKVSKYYGIPVILHTDHCHKKIIPWIDILLKKSETHFQKNKTPIFSSHMIDLSQLTIQENIDICKKFLIRMHKINMILEIELGCTGGEEDGINNNHLNSHLLYTTPEEINYAYQQLINISPNFIIAASFGNTHGVYAPGKINLKPNILKKAQQYIKKINNLNVNNPINFVFHGGSGSSIVDIQKSIKYGVVKINVDTDIQWASWLGILKYYNSNKQYLQKQLITINNIYKPTKKYYDPRKWIAESKQSISRQLKKIFKIFNCYNLL